jgi:hypothetical protein
MVEYWNIGLRLVEPTDRREKMGFGLRLVEPTPRGAYASERILEDWVNGVIVLTIKLKMDNIL